MGNVTEKIIDLIDDIIACMDIDQEEKSNLWRELHEIKELL